MREYSHVWRQPLQQPSACYLFSPWLGHCFTSGIQSCVKQSFTISSLPHLSYLPLLDHEDGEGVHFPLTLPLGILLFYPIQRGKAVSLWPGNTPCTTSPTLLLVLTLGVPHAWARPDSPLPHSSSLYCSVLPHSRFCILGLLLGEDFIALSL